MAFKCLLFSVILAVFAAPHYTSSAAVWPGHPYSFVTPNIIPYPTRWINRQAPFNCQVEGWFPDPVDCTLFYRCVRLALLGEDYYLAYPFQCPPGTAWDQYDEASGGCDPISEISRCDENAGTNTLEKKKSA